MSEVEKDAENTKQRVYDFDKDDIQIKINGLEKYRKQLQEDKDDYDGMYTLFKSKDNDKTGTQKLKDSNVTLSQEKTLALIWGIVSVSMLMILLFRPRINST
jgi:beta-lactamase class D